MNTKALLEPMGSWAWWRSWFLIFLGCSVMGAGFVLFVNPYKFVPGGVYGMGIVLHNIFPSVQVGTFGYMFDIPLMLISMLVSVVEHLKQDVHDVRMRLLDLIEEHDRIRVASYLLGELSRLVVADVSGR